MTKTFAESLLRCMNGSDEQTMRLASKALLYLIQTSKSYAVEIAELTMRACGDDDNKLNEQGRLVSLVLIHDFALFASQYFFKKVTYFFDHVFKYIREHKNLRHIACRALHAALYVVSQREHRQKEELYKRCLNEAAIRSPATNKEEALYSSLLIYNEILRIGLARSDELRLCKPGKPRNILEKTKSFATSNPVVWLMDNADPPIVESKTAQGIILERFSEVQRTVSEAKSSKNAKIQEILLEVYPRMFGYAAIHKDGAPLPGLRESLPSLAANASRSSAVLSCLGLICLHDPDHTAEIPKTLFDVIIKHHLPSKAKSSSKVDDAVFRTLCFIIRSHPQVIANRIRELLPILFKIGFVEGVIDVLQQIVVELPSMATDVHDGLLDILYRTLMDQERPSKLDAPKGPPAPDIKIMFIHRDNVPMLCLALKALGMFDFQRHTLQMFIKFVAQGYLHCDQAEIRIAAVDCCAKIVNPFIAQYKNIESSEQKSDCFGLIRNILEGLINLAVVDREVDVRIRVLNAFKRVKDRDFLFHLAQRDMLDTLFMTLYDENPQVQEAAVGLLGVLAELNPAYVFPKLRRVLHETMGQLANSKINNLEEQSAKCIAVLADTSPKFIMPYMDNILKVLEPHLSYEKRTVGITVHVLNALSNLASLGGTDIVKHLPTLFRPLMQYLQDSTSLYRREASLKAMIGFCQSTAYVVDPYREYPELLDILLKLLKSEVNMNMRRLTIKTLGVIGALDPYTYKVFLGTVSSTKSRTIAVSLPTMPESDDPRHDIIKWINYEKCTLVQFYPSIAIATLMQMMHDESLTLLHKQIVQALQKIFRDLPKENLKQYVHQVLPKLIALTEASNQEFRQFYMEHFCQLAPLFALNMKPYLREIIRLIAVTWQDYVELRGVVIDLLAAIGEALGSDFSPFVTDLCPYLLTVVQMDQTEKKEMILKALNCVRAINPCLDPHLHLIVPPENSSDAPFCGTKCGTRRSRTPRASTSKRARRATWTK